MYREGGRRGYGGERFQLRSYCGCEMVLRDSGILRNQLFSPPSSLVFLLSPCWAPIDPVHMLAFCQAVAGEDDGIGEDFGGFGDGNWVHGDDSVAAAEPNGAERKSP